MNVNGQRGGSGTEYCEQITRWVMEVAKTAGYCEADAQRFKYCYAGRAAVGGGRECVIAHQYD